LFAAPGRHIGHEDHGIPLGVHRLSLPFWEAAAAAATGGCCDYGLY
jgi:hypothetical protein